MLFIIGINKIILILYVLRKTHIFGCQPIVISPYMFLNTPSLKCMFTVLKLSLYMNFLHILEEIEGIFYIFHTINVSIILIYYNI
ncbi:hypothetical protein M5D96_014257, partial [Drosophila gunungcola]